MRIKLAAFLLLAIVIFSLSLNAQVKYEYCYCPRDNSQRVIEKQGNITFRVSNFKSDEITQLEFDASKADGSNFGTVQVFLSAGSFSPNGKRITDNPRPSESDTHIGFHNLRLPFAPGAQSIDIYVNLVTEDRTVSYAGPITIYRDIPNSATYTAFQLACTTDCPDKIGKDKPDSTIDWDLRPPSRIIINKEGEKQEVLTEELMNARILPTPGMLSLLEELNPALSNKAILNAGTEIILPDFPEIDSSLQGKLQASLNGDNIPDVTQTAVFLERSKFTQIILQNVEIPSGNEVVKNDLIAIYDLLTNIIQNPKFRLKKRQANLLNSELENFYKYLINDLPRKDSNSDLSYIRQFKDYLFHIVPATKKTTVRGDGGPNSGSENISDAYPEDDAGIFLEEGNMAVYIYAFESATSAPLNNYRIYYISEFQHDQLLKTGNQITVADLNKITTPCHDLASPAAVSVDPSLTYFFIAVDKNIKQIKMCSKVNIENLPKKSGNKFINKPYAVPLYKDDDCSQN